MNDKNFQIVFSYIVFFLCFFESKDEKSCIYGMLFDFFFEIFFL